MEPPAAYAAVADAAGLLSAARQDSELAAELLALPAPDGIAAARHDPRFHRLTLVKLLALRTESELFAPAGDPRPMGELGAALAAVLPADRAGSVRNAAAVAHWLLGKAQLKAAQVREAHGSFRAMDAFLPEGGPSEEEALAFAGRAQVAADSGDLDAAFDGFTDAADVFCRLEASAPAAACYAELGLVLLAAGDPCNAQSSIEMAFYLLPPAFGPSLAARLHLALAEIAANLGDLGAAREQLRRAQALYPLAPSATEAIARCWAEARIAAAAREPARAEELLATVGREPFERGVLAEAARATFDRALLRIDLGRIAAVPELAAPLALAFPGAGERWAAEIAALALAARRPEAYHALRASLRRRLYQLPEVASGPHRPSLLAPSRLLIDRLLRHRGDHEDPVGAAAGL
jgi:tetratricopeptide (TPR) repeat protein